jgi:hypothetical protein
MLADATAISVIAVVRSVDRLWPSVGHTLGSDRQRGQTRLARLVCVNSHLSSETDIGLPSIGLAWTLKGMPHRKLSRELILTNGLPDHGQCHGNCDEAHC